MKNENQKVSEIAAVFETLKNEDKETLKALSDHFAEKSAICDGDNEPNLQEYYEIVCGTCFAAIYANK